MKRNNSRHHSSFMIIGSNIRTFRERLNISQEELAFKISSTRNYIGCIERGEKFPSIAVIFDIAKALNIQPKDFFEGT